MRAHTRPGRLVAAAALLALAPAALPAGPASGQEIRRVEVASDNDAYNFWTPVHRRPDRDYTHGMWAAVELDAAPGWGRLAPGLRPCRAGAPAAERCLSTRLELGQKIYTPRRDAEDPLPGERAYAGWLYASATGRVSDLRMRRSLGVEVGVTGDPSLGRWVHTQFHRAARFWEPAGWDDQVGFEPAVAVRYEEARIAWEGRTAGGVRWAEVRPEWGADMGSLATGARAGLRLRAGRGVPHPWRTGQEGTDVSVYAVGSVRGDWVAHDLFLNGGTLAGDAPRVAHRPFVVQYQVGGGVRWRGLSAEYVVTNRGREYATQLGGHSYTKMAIVWRR